MNTVITIGRQYAAGGRKIGEYISQKLNVPCYDEKLLTEAAVSSGIPEELFKEYDEKRKSSFLEPLSTGAYYGNNLPMSSKLFLIQFETIKKLADRGSCVFIGRCADYILRNRENIVSAFISMDFDKRVKRAVSEFGRTEKNIESYVKKTDRRRAAYYEYYSGKSWGAASSYDICLDVSKIDFEQAGELIIVYSSLLKQV